MKCPVCGGETVEKEKEYLFAGKKIGFNCLECMKCGEKLVLERDAEHAFKELAKAKEEEHYRKKISYSGNSLVLRIPAKLAEAYGLRKGKTVELVGTKEGIQITA